MAEPSVEEVFAGPLFRVEVQRWPDPERRRDVVRHPGAAAVLPVTPEGRVVLVRQLREAVGSELLEIPAGICDVAGEPPEETARRELREETGYRATALRLLCTIHTSPGFTDERIDVFAAEAERGGPPERGIEVVEMALSEALGAVGSGEITDAKSIVALLFTARAGPAGAAG